jgi:hypothetical protein
MRSPVLVNSLLAPIYCQTLIRTFKGHSQPRMLCDVCKSVDFGDLYYRASQLDQSRSYIAGSVTTHTSHHPSYASLKAAAEQSCDLCMEILKGAEKYGTRDNFDSINPTIRCYPKGVPQYRTRNGDDGYRGVTELILCATVP